VECRHQQGTFGWLAECVARAEEPFRQGFDREELRELLLEYAFTRVKNLDSEASCARYFTSCGDGLAVRGGLGRLACAWRE
jgi:hypothetical protein